MSRDKKRLLLLCGTSLLTLQLVAAPLTLAGHRGSFGVQAAQAQEASCFVAGTLVLMADGSVRPIETLRPGDAVLGRRGRVNRVVGNERTRLGQRRLYGFNGQRPFVTAEHPFLTSEGWKALDPEATRRENHRLPVTTLLPGDLLCRGLARRRAGAAEAGLLFVQSATVLEALTAFAADPRTPLFNLLLDGDHSYVADGWVVHNKEGDGGNSGDGASDSGASDGGDAGGGDAGGGDAGAGDTGGGDTGGGDAGGGDAGGGDAGGGDAGGGDAGGGDAGGGDTGGGDTGGGDTGGGDTGGGDTGGGDAGGGDTGGGDTGGGDAGGGDAGGGDAGGGDTGGGDAGGGDAGGGDAGGGDAGGGDAGGGDAGGGDAGGGDAGGGDTGGGDTGGGDTGGGDTGGGDTGGGDAGGGDTGGGDTGGGDTGGGDTGGGDTGGGDAGGGDAGGGDTGGGDTGGGDPGDGDTGGGDTGGGDPGDGGQNADTGPAGAETGAVSDTHAPAATGAAAGVKSVARHSSAQQTKGKSPSARSTLDTFLRSLGLGGPSDAGLAPTGAPLSAEQERQAIAHGWRQRD